MRLDKDKMNELVGLDDEALWQRIVEIGAAYGFKLPTKAPAHDELEKLRETVRDGARMNVTQAVKLLNKYRSN